ncbi:MAG: diacylglycerol kinase [Burkholderiales bacterium]
MKNPQKNRSGLRRWVYALGFSILGLKAAYQYEKAFRLEVYLAVFMLPAAFWLGQNWVERSLLAGSVIAVMAAELGNSAIETTIDRISMERHDLSGRAKDLGSACVLLLVLWMLLVWGSALWNRFGGA